MIDFSETSIGQIIVHHIGNKYREEECTFSAQELNLDDDQKANLLPFFLNAFKEPVFFNFTSDNGAANNIIWRTATGLFSEPDSFTDTSCEIGKYLYDNSTIEKIKGGDLFVVLLNGCVVDDEWVDALGIFKCETKENRLKVLVAEEGSQVKTIDGILGEKIDRGCLIFNTEKDLGYKIAMHAGKGVDAEYWMYDFLGVKQREDNFYQTQKIMEVCKGFVSEVYNEENNIEKTEQIDMLNKSAKYFKEKEKFDMKEFEEEVLCEPGVIKAFDEYKNYYQNENDTKIEESFDISETAVKKGKAQFKNILKLDKNFHIYIHGDREKIIKGFDQDKNMHYYTIYFESEE